MLDGHARRRDGAVPIGLERKVTRVSLQRLMMASFAVFVCLAIAPATAFAQQPAQPAEPPPDWTGSAGAGVAVTSGNSDTTNYNLAFDLTNDPKQRNVVKFTSLYLRGEQDDEVTVNRTSIMGRDEYSLTQRMFVFGQVDYLRDTFKLIDYLIAPTGGVGYKVIDTMATKFAVDVGVGGVWEKNPGIDVRSSGAVTAGEKLTHQLTATSTIKHSITALWKTQDIDDSLYTFNIGLGTKITERIQLSIDLLDTYKNLPPTPDTDKNDVALVTALTAKF
jgi:putative salt-induced outer membrane protein YdiY